LLRAHPRHRGAQEHGEAKRRRAYVHLSGRPHVSPPVVHFLDRINPRRPFYAFSEGSAQPFSVPRRRRPTVISVGLEGPRKKAQICNPFGPCRIISLFRRAPLITQSSHRGFGHYDSRLTLRPSSTKAEIVALCPSPTPRPVLSGRAESHVRSNAYFEACSTTYCIDCRHSETYR
jgi:hypothetical protein